MNATTSSVPRSRGPADHTVRDQIVEAAHEHFSRFGYEKTTVSDLAKSIGFSKAYIYKFFDSKQAIGEAICAKTISAMVGTVEEAVAGATTPTEKFRRMFKVLVATGVTLFFSDRKLYDVAAHAAGEGWPPARAYAQRIKQILTEIVREGVPVTVRCVVLPQRGEKGVFANLNAQHVQHEPALLVTIAIQQGEQIGLDRVDDRTGRNDLLVAEDCRPNAAHLSPKGAVAVCMAAPQRCEVRGESFGEPDVRPFALSDRIAEPLVRRLVRDQPFIHPALTEAFVEIEDRARVLHASKSRGRL